jgi:hypothetical protein
MEQSLHHRIRERAFAIWNAGGRMEGQAEHHWLAAEREVLAEMSAHIAGPETSSSSTASRRRRDQADLGLGRKKRMKAS